jgi:hypothetical protein
MRVALIIPLAADNMAADTICGVGSRSICVTAVSTGSFARPEKLGTA